MLTSHNIFAGFCSEIRRKRVPAFCLFLCTLGLAVSANAQQLRFTTFDVTAAGTSAFQGTQSQDINLQGEISGYYIDSNGVFHGFERNKGGEIVTFDAPGAGPTGTFAFGNNIEGAIAGFYYDENSLSHAYLRSPTGHITTVEAPGATNTFAAQITPAGVIAGDYLDASSNLHGYLRAPNGNITTFEAPGAGTGADPQGTFTGFVDCVNPEGAMTGSVGDASNVIHGYVRAPNGKITTFDAPGADTIDAGNGTFPAGINLFGTIEGNYFDASNVSHGFVRAPDGNITTFDAPGADTIDTGYGTFPSTLNDFGVISGYYLDSNGVFHGFLRNPVGKFTTFDAPGADLTPNNFNGTFPIGINLMGQITGYYSDAQFVAHGFVAVPCDHSCPAKNEAASAKDASPARTIKPVKPALPEMLNQKWRWPWYRSFGVQPTK
jgi:hypothetical protein